MAKNERKRQKALEKHRIKRKQAHTSARSTGSSSSKVNLRAAAMWPVKECWISEDWQREGEIVQIIVARESPAGSVAVATFLTDLACMGVKSAFSSVFASADDYHREVLDACMSQLSMVQTDINMVAKILKESVAYARQWDIRPDPDYTEASKLLGNADPEASHVLVPLGVRGKPLFAAGPYDNVNLILAKLERTAGPGNYDCIVPPVSELDMPSGDEDEEDEADEEDEEDESLSSWFRTLPPRG